MRKELASRLWRASEATGDLAVAFPAVGDLSSRLVQQHGAGSPQESMPSGVVQPFGAAEGDRGHTVARSYPCQPVGYARQAHEARGGNEHARFHGRRRGLVIQKHDALRHAARLQVHLRQIDAHLNAVAQQVWQPLRPGDQIPAAIRAHGRTDHPQNRLAGVKQCDRDRGAAIPLQPGRRAVVRVHEPAEVRSVSLQDPQFFALKPARHHRVQGFLQVRLDFDVDPSLVAGATRAIRTARLLDQHFPGVGDGSDHRRQQLIDNWHVTPFRTTTALRLQHLHRPLTDNLYSTQLPDWLPFARVSFGRLCNFFRKNSLGRPICLLVVAGLVSDLPACPPRTLPQRPKERFTLHLVRLSRSSARQLR